MEIAAFVVSVMAAIFAAGSAWYARKSVRESRRSANAAHRSADAAEETVGYKREEVERNRIAFDLEHQHKSAYALWNRGTDTAYGVKVDPGDLFVREPLEWEEFPDEHAEQIILAQTFGTATNHLTVTWHHQPDRSDEPQETRLLIGRGE